MEKKTITMEEYNERKFIIIIITIITTLFITFVFDMLANYNNITYDQNGNMCRGGFTKICTGK